MGWRLPPLNALRAFEAAGRHCSVMLAAEELHVPPGAVSRQIKLLGTTLGPELFARHNREVRLTAESAPCLTAVPCAVPAPWSCRPRRSRCRRYQRTSSPCSMLAFLDGLAAPGRADGRAARVRDKHYAGISPAAR